MSNCQKFKYYLIFIIFLFPFSTDASTVGERLGGRILLQVEQNGEAWYVSPATNLRYFLGRPDDAYALMRKQGIGISNSDLKKIPVALDVDYGVDSDGDGLDDRLEDSLGTDKHSKDSDGDGYDDLAELNSNFNPLGNDRYDIDLVFINKQLGKIFLQVEKRGEAWYVNPVDKKRYFLGKPEDAFLIMRKLGLGINNKDLNKIVQAEQIGDFLELETLIHADVNNERTKKLLSEVQWNSELAKVAKVHSQSLADENEVFTGIGRTCDYPMIHHEDLTKGFYSSDRLKEENVFYFSEAGENIALYSASSYKVSYYEGGNIGKELSYCPEEREILGATFKSKIDESDNDDEKRQIIISEIEKRKKLFESKTSIEPKDFSWYENDFLSKEITEGWMNSPGHRANILNSDYNEAGIGVVIANGYAYATQIFIKRAECGFTNGPCCTKKGYLPYCFVPLECSNNICL